MVLSVVLGYIVETLAKLPDITWYAMTSVRVSVSDVIFDDSKVTVGQS